MKRVRHEAHGHAGKSQPFFHRAKRTSLFSRDDINMVLDYGRRLFFPGVEVFLIGRKEVDNYKDSNKGITKCRGMMVILDVKTNEIINCIKRKKFNYNKIF